MVEVVEGKAWWHGRQNALPTTTPRRYEGSVKKRARTLERIRRFIEEADVWTHLVVITSYSVVLADEKRCKNGENGESAAAGCGTAPPSSLADVAFDMVCLDEGEFSVHVSLVLS